MDLNKIYQMDCRDFLRRLPDNILDLAIIDLPYNMNKANRDTFERFEGYMAFTQEWDLLLPKLKQTACLYLFNMPYNNAFILPYLVQKICCLKIG